MVGAQRWWRSRNANSRSLAGQAFRKHGADKLARFDMTVERIKMCSEEYGVLVRNESIIDSLEIRAGKCLLRQKDLMRIKCYRLGASD